MVSGGQWKALEPTRVPSLGKPSLPLLPAGGRRSLGSVPSALASSLYRSGCFYLLTPLPFPCSVSNAGQAPEAPSAVPGTNVREWMPNGSKSGDRNQIGTGNSSLGTACGRLADGIPWSSVSVPASQHRRACPLPTVRPG